jgi:hypothetical protein
MDVRQVDAFQKTIRLSRTMGSADPEIVDSENPNRVVAVSEGICVRLGETPGDSEGTFDAPTIEVIDWPDLPPPAPGLRRILPGRRRVAASRAHTRQGVTRHRPPHPANRDLLETAARFLAEERADTDALQIEARHIAYLARGKIGPFRASGEAVANPDGKIPVQVALHDEGNDDRVVTSALPGYRPAG